MTGAWWRQPGQAADLIVTETSEADRQGDMVLAVSTRAVITVRWMDGEMEVYRDPSRHQVEDGVLIIDFSRGSAESQFPRMKTVYLPLANIREFTVESPPPEP